MRNEKKEEISKKERKERRKGTRKENVERKKGKGDAEGLFSHF